MNLSSRFLKVFKVGAVTTWSGNPFHEEITLTEKSSRNSCGLLSYKIFSLACRHDLLLDFHLIKKNV